VLRGKNKVMIIEFRIKVKPRLPVTLWHYTSLFMIIIAVGAVAAAVAVTKVKYASRKKVPPTAACQHLYISKCYELANYYIGFNAWNVTITSVSVDAC